MTAAARFHDAETPPPARELHGAVIRTRAGDGRVPVCPGRAGGYRNWIVGSLLVFAALGFFAPMRFAALAAVPRILALAAGGSVLIETAQYVLQLDRVSSVDDVLLNAAGAAPAALASRRWWRTTPEPLADRPHLQGETARRRARTLLG